MFIDLKKAFDTVPHNILLNKLERIGIRGIQLSIFRDYLSNRKQNVRIEGCTSEDVGVTCGVPQGSVLGPTLFLVYINDLCNLALNNAKIISYADVTAIIFTGSSWSSTKTASENGMKRVAQWLKNYLLTLNTGKTNFMCFSIYNNFQPNYELSLKIHTCDETIRNDCCCPIINKVELVKYLGVMVDQRLSWYPQLEMTMSRIRKFNWIFKTLRHIVPTNMIDGTGTPRNLLNEIYISLVQSITTYCIPIWGGAHKSRFLMLERASQPRQHTSL